MIVQKVAPRAEGIIRKSVLIKKNKPVVQEHDLYCIWQKSEFGYA